jgi:hypothetical protein
MPKGVNMSGLQMKSIEERITKFVKCVQRRNLRETIVSVILIVTVAFNITYGISQQRKDNFSIINSAIIIFALLLNIIIIRWKLHIPKAEISTYPPTRFPDKWRHHLTHQARMLRLAWLRYLLPLFVGIFIFILNVYDFSSLSFIILLLCEIAAFIGTLRMNLKAAKQLERDRDAWFGRSN